MGLVEKGSQDWAACACLPTHTSRCLPACLSCSATLVWTALPPQGRLTDSTSLGHTRSAGAAARPTHASARSQSAAAAVSAAAPSPRTHSRLRPQHSLYITCACILFVPFHISPKASVALLICSLASRSCSSHPPTATAPGRQRVVCRVQRQGILAPPFLIGWHADCLQLGNGLRQVQQVWEHNRLGKRREDLGGAVAAAGPPQDRSQHAAPSPPSIQGQPCSRRAGGAFLLLIEFSQFQGAPRPSGRTVAHPSGFGAIRACLYSCAPSATLQSPPCLKSENAHMFICLLVLC